LPTENKNIKVQNANGDALLEWTLDGNEDEEQLCLENAHARSLELRRHTR
jgi:hypothetical protein